MSSPEACALRYNMKTDLLTCSKTGFKLMAKIFLSFGDVSAEEVHFSCL